MFPYGNFRNQMADSLILGWETYDARPRFGTNWTGLRGQMAILRRAYSNDQFPGAHHVDLCVRAGGPHAGGRGAEQHQAAGGGVGTAEARFGGGLVDPGTAH